MPLNNPKQCDFSLPNHCILKCRMCNFWKNDLSFEDSGWLKTEEYKEFIYQLRDFVDDPFCISFGGGEPLLYADKLFEVTRTAQELGLRCYFPTNAYLIDEAMAKRIAETGISSIGISLDTIDSKKHDFLRGKVRCYERAIQAIELLKKYSPKITINILAVIMGHNLEDIVDLTKWVYRHQGLRGIVFQAIQKPFNANFADNWYESKEYADLWPGDTKRVNSILDELIALRRFKERGFKICNPIAQLEVFKLYFNGPASFRRPARCHMGNEVIRIDASGNIMLCDQMDSLGNIKRSSIRQIWHSQKASEIRADIYNCDKNCYHLVNCFYDGESS